MAPRANWKGTLRIAEVLCPVALYTAASTSERVSFHTINRATGHRVRREFVDGETGKPVERDDQVKGYELAKDEYITLDPSEIAAAIPESDKVLDVSAFIACGDVDDIYFDRPYYLAPADRAGEDVYILIREGLRRTGTVALARTMLFRRMRSLLVRAQGDGLVATTLNFDYEVRSAEEAFADISAIRIEGEMLDLARHIIGTKMGRFDISAFDDRYENALIDLVRAKQEGRRIAPPPKEKAEKVVDLLAALRESAGMAGKAPRGRKAPPASRRKAG